MMVEHGTIYKSISIISYGTNQQYSKITYRYVCFSIKHIYVE